ncbi:hypothetical protein Emag_007897 [Eimeria magna]
MVMMMWWLMMVMMMRLMMMMMWLMVMMMWMVGMWIMGLIMLVIRIVGFASGRHGVLRQEVLAEELVQEEDARGDLIGHISDFSGLVGLNLLLLGNGSSRLGVGLLCLREAVIRCTDLRAGWHGWRKRALPGRAGETACREIARKISTARSAHRGLAVVKSDIVDSHLVTRT